MAAEFRWVNKQVAVRVPVQAVRKVAAEVLAQAVARCPQDTGNLARSIHMAEHKGAQPGWTVGTPVHYAPHVEFGTRYMRAQPFLGPALASAARKYA